MPETKEKVEQWRIVFKERWAKPVNKDDEDLFDEDFHAFIRSVVEECCEAIEKSSVCCEWHINEIRNHFAWLLE